MSVTLEVRKWKQEARTPHMRNLNENERQKIELM